MRPSARNAARTVESHRLRVQADAVAGALPPLLVPARRVAATMLGSHGRRAAGIGESFWQFRPYSSDDAPQAIDWRQSGKVDTVYVREREWVAAQTAALWCDTSPSMRYRSGAALPTKAERAAVMTLALSELLIDAGERIVRLAGSGKLAPAARSGRLAVAQLADAIADELAEPSTLQAEMPAFDQPLPRHSAIVMMSDFLAPIETITAAVQSLAHQQVTGHMLQVLDPAEETLPFSGRIRFIGMENEGATVIDRTEDARQAYAGKLAAHRDALQALARKAGFSFGVHHTDRSPQLALAALHNAITGHRR